MIGHKNDKGKPRVDLLSAKAMVGCAEVLGFGAAKYAADNWRMGLEWRRVIAAATRHLMAFSDGEDTDPESGLPHIDHAMCCVMFLSEYQKTGNGTDDRYVAPDESFDVDDAIALIAELRDCSSRAAGLVYDAMDPADKGSAGAIKAYLREA